VNLTILPAAQLEATDAAVWYDDQRPRLGDEFLTELHRAMERIRHEPISFGRAEFYSGPREIRRCLMSRFPYLILFECRADESLIVAISHTRRRPLYWLERLD
jgi:ParE toxin of type II toxin-antitoxin system, parDE